MKTQCEQKYTITLKNGIEHIDNLRHFPTTDKITNNIILIAGRSTTPEN